MGLTAEAYALMQASLLPPGRLWRTYPGSVLRGILLAAADELVRVSQRALDLIEESDPRTADELLPDYERELEITSEGTDAERQARIVARHLIRQRVRPVDYQRALAPLLGQEVADVVVMETSRADAVAMGNDREIYRFFIYRDPTLPGAYDLDAAQALVDDVSHRHTQGHVVESINFLTDDPYSLTDRDILGA